MAYRVVTPATRRALAYCYLTGRLPSYLHLGTWSAARDLLGPMDSKAFYQVLPDALDAVRADPLAQAGDFLKSCGFTYRHDYSTRKRTSHSVAFHHSDIALEAYASRYGGGWIWIRRKSVPYQVSLHYTAGQAGAYMAAPGAWLAWQRLAQDLLRDVAGAYRQADAWTWHAAGRDPIAYAVHAVRKALPE